MSTLKTKIIQPPSDSDGLTFRTNQTDRATIGADGFVSIANGTLTGGITLNGTLNLLGGITASGTAIFNSKVQIRGTTTSAGTLYVAGNNEFNSDGFPWSGGGGILVTDTDRASIKLQDTSNGFFCILGAADNGSTSNLTIGTSGGNGSDYDGSAIVFYPGTLAEVGRIAKQGFVIGGPASGSTLDIRGGITMTNNIYMSAASSAGIKTKGDLVFTAGATGMNTAKETVRITTTGNVGIGTATPEVSLDVNGSGRFVSAGSGNVTGAIILKEDSGNNTPYIQWVDKTNTTNRGNIGVDSSYNMRFYVGSSGTTERFCITNSGNVGIGTATPGVSLDVRGTGNFSGLLTLAGATSSAIISCATAPTLGQHLANKTYVDTVVANVVGVPTTFSTTSPPIGTIIVVENVGSGNVFSVTIGATISPRYQTTGHYNLNTAGTLVSGTWKIICGFNDDSGNPSTKALAIRTA